MQMPTDPNPRPQVPDANTRFAEAVQRVLKEHGATLRSQRQRTGLAHSTILTWIQGAQPRMEAVIQFARGFGLDVNEWLVLAGYEPIEASPEEALETIIESVEQLEYDPEFEGVTIRGYQGAENLTPEQIELANRVVRALLTQQRRKRGEE